MTTPASNVRAYTVFGGPNTRVRKTRTRSTTSGREAGGPRGLTERSGAPPSPLLAGPHVKPEVMAMTDMLAPTPVKWLYCFACEETFELAGSDGSCGCGRSSARLDGGIVEIQGPARALAPVETVIRLDGGEWAPLPEDVFIRRVLPRAA
jgi:hypothetical protein